MINLAERLHCPRCKGRLTGIAATIANGFPAGSLCCTSCEWSGPVAGGIADLVGDGISDLLGDRGAPDSDSDHFNTLDLDDTPAGALLARIRAVAGDRWPGSLGEVTEIGCGNGQITCAMASGTHGAIQGLFVTDMDIDRLRACRERFADGTPAAACPIGFAHIDGRENPIRDAVADTVIGASVLSETADVPAFLAMVHRILRPGGRAVFVVPNRRYHLAMCRALADSLVHLYAHDGRWPAQGNGAFQLLETLRLPLVHQGDVAFLSTLRDKHLFDPDRMEDLALELGFAGADLIAMEPDPLGGETARRLLQQAGLQEPLLSELAPLVASAGAPYFGLLGRPDQSASMLLWLTKSVGPRLRTFTAPSPVKASPFVGAESALGGMPPRWSIEVAAHDTDEGVVATIGGWCLVNTDVVWVRMRLGDLVRDAPVWRTRPDVHEVLNGRGLYHALNAICSGVDATLMFDGLHPVDGQCQLHLEVVLANGVVAKGPSPETLVMNERLVIAQ